MTTISQRSRKKPAKSLTAEDVRFRFPETVKPGASVQEAAARMRAFGVGFLPVVHHERLVGVVTDRDLATRVLPYPSELDRTTVEEIMTPEVVTCDSRAPISLVMRTLSILKIRRIPVLGPGQKLQGVIGLGDLVRAGEGTTTGWILSELCRPISVLPVGMPDL